MEKNMEDEPPTRTLRIGSYGAARKGRIRQAG